VNDRKLSLRSAADDCHDPIAEGKTCHAGADGCHHPGELETRDVRRPTWRGRVQAGPLQQISVVQARGVDSDEHLTDTRHGVGSFLHGEGALLDYNGAHGLKGTQGDT
jgi:hypothetical protein